MFGLGSSLKVVLPNIAGDSGFQYVNGEDLLE